MCSSSLQERLEGRRMKNMPMGIIVNRHGSIETTMELLMPKLLSPSPLFKP
jgi:hypothetical protein